MQKSPYAHLSTDELTYKISEAVAFLRHVRKNVVGQDERQKAARVRQKLRQLRSELDKRTMRLEGF